jgi:hypothetical protein
MKKLWIVAVLLTAGLCVSSYAQEIKFDGYVNSGLGVVYSTEKGAADPFLAAAGVDSGSNAFRIRLNAAYANEAGNAGAFLRLQASGGYNSLTLPAAYGWFRAFDNAFAVKGGIVDDGTWNTGGAFLNGDMGEGLGALARISPLIGLDIGLGVFLAETPGDTQGNSLFVDYNRYKNGQYYARDLDKAKYTFSLGYTLPELFKFAASYRPRSEAGISAANPYLPSRLRAGASLLAVPNLKAVLELELDNLQDFKAMNAGDTDAWGKSSAGGTAASGKINLFETLQYDQGNLSVGLWAVQWLSQAEGADLSLYANPWVSYAFGPIVPRLDLGYGSGVQAGFNNDNLNWRRGNYGPVYDKDVSVISIRPSVKINLDSKTSVEIGDLIDLDGNKTTKWGKDDSRISNVFYVDFKWSF